MVGLEPRRTVEAVGPGGQLLAVGCSGRDRDLQGRLEQWSTAAQSNADEHDSAVAETPAAARPALTSDYVAPRNTTEETLARIWQDALGIDRIGVEDNFTGVVDLLTQKAWVWGGRDDPEDYEITDVPEDMQDLVEEWREKLIETAVEQDDDLLEE